MHELEHGIEVSLTSCAVTFSARAVFLESVAKLKGPPAPKIMCAHDARNFLLLYFF